MLLGRLSTAPKLGLPKGMGTDPGSPFHPHHFPPGSPTLMVTGGCGCPLAGAGGQSSSGPVPHMHPSAFHGQQQESWSIPHQKNTKDKPSFLPCQALLPPSQPSAEKAEIIFNFRNNWGLMEVTAGGYCSSPQEKKPQVFPVSPQSSALLWLFQAGTGGTSAAQRKLRLSEAESGVFPILVVTQALWFAEPSAVSIHEAPLSTCIF